MKKFFVLLFIFVIILGTNVYAASLPYDYIIDGKEVSEKLDDGSAIISKDSTSVTLTLNNYNGKSRCPDNTHTDGEGATTANACIEDKPFVCPGEYTANSNATNETECYLKTTAGKYVAYSGDLNQKTCPTDNYCPGNVIVHFGEKGGIQSCGANATTENKTGRTSKSDCKELCEVEIQGPNEIIYAGNPIGEYTAAAKYKKSNNILEYDASRIQWSIVSTNGIVRDSTNGINYLLEANGLNEGRVQIEATVTAPNGRETCTATKEINILQDDFELSTETSDEITLQAGESKTVVMTVSSIGGFVDRVQQYGYPTTSNKTAASVSLTNNSVCIIKLFGYHKYFC